MTADPNPPEWWAFFTGDRPLPTTIPAGCTRCGVTVADPGRCALCIAELGHRRLTDVDADRTVARLLDLPARVPGLAAVVGFRHHHATGAAPSADRWGYVDVVALHSAARRHLPAAATARPRWAGPRGGDHR